MAKYHSGDEKAADYLIEKYKNLVRKNVRSYYLAGADNEDLLAISNRLIEKNKKAYEVLAK